MKVRKLLFLLVFLSGCANSSSSQQRDLMLATLERLNAAENQSLDNGLEKKIAGIDATMADSWEGWSNGVHAESRAVERERERVLFRLFPNYRRTFDLIVIEPPYASVLWTISGTATTNGYQLQMKGATTFEFDADGTIMRAWLHTGQQPTAADLGLGAEAP